jgi:hypothetical protein
MKDLPVMSVKEARKLLGKEAQDMDDQQIMQVILLLAETAKAQLQKNYVKKSTKGLG